VGCVFGAFDTCRDRSNHPVLLPVIDEGIAVGWDSEGARDRDRGKEHVKLRQVIEQDVSDLRLTFGGSAI
jgi:hypothetical protein